MKIVDCGLWIAVLTMCGLCGAQQLAEKSPAITVSDQGVLMKDGKPYRGIGINYFSAFSRALANPNDTSYRQGFDELAKRGIPFIRFMAGGFWPKDWRLYCDDREAYFARMDGVVKAAEEKGIGLIPSLFWWTTCTSDLVDEPRGQWGNPQSKTMAFMRQYVREMTTRYAASPAIWAWELGNEYSLDADLPNAAECRPWVHLDLGTRKERGPADDMTQDMIVTACREFASEVRKYDTSRPITTGHSLPRPAIFHMRTEKSWAADTHEQFTTNLIEVSPAPIDLVSIHVYPFDKEGRFGEKTNSYAEVLTLCMDACKKANKALFVGEFGASDTEKEGGPERARANTLDIIAAIESSGVPLAALWVFDLSDQDSFINVTPTNARSYLLDELSKANQRMHAAVASQEKN